MTNAASFNVLTDRWIPLDDGSGKVAYASYVELMTGARDGADLVHPRDDVRFFSRMLLSALTQALFGDLVPDAAALRRQLEEPLAAAIVEERVAKVKEDFELVGPNAFLQGPARKEKKEEKGGDEVADSMLFDASKHQLYRNAAGVGVVGLESAVPLLYAAQAFARSGGSGYFPGVRGRPPVTTLVRLPSARASIWANVLHGQRRLGYPNDPARPWKQGQSDAAGPVGLVEGLFWQPLAARVSWTPSRAARVCAATGAAIAERGIAVERLGGRMRMGAYWFPHPYSPVIEADSKPKFLHFKSDRPAWTGLGEVLPGLSADGKHRVTQPAPVVEQWAELDAQVEASLVILDYATDNASVLARFVELFPLSAALRDERLAAFAAIRVEEADAALRVLRSRLFPVDAKKKHGEVFLARTSGRKNTSDVTAAFWQRTEPLFWTAFESKVKGEDGRDAFRRGVARVVVRIFDEATAVLDGQPEGLARVVVQRQRLARELPRALDMLDLAGEAR